MLTYLDSLIAALTVRDAADIERLLAHPLARILPPEARVEAETFRDGQCDTLAAPLRVMQLRHQASELLRDSYHTDKLPDVIPARVIVSSPSRVRPSQAQIELPLSA